MLNLLIELAVAFFYDRPRNVQGEVQDDNWAWHDAVQKLKFKDNKEAFEFLDYLLGLPELKGRFGLHAESAEDPEDFIGSLLVVYGEPFREMVRARIPDYDEILALREAQIEAEDAAHA